MNKILAEKENAAERIKMPLNAFCGFSNEKRLGREDLHPYQRKIIRHIVETPGAGVFADMGLGKSVSTLTAISDLMFDMLEVSKCLIIAPKRVAESTWSDEKNKWKHLEHLRLSVAVGSEKERIKALMQPADIYIINRENIPWLKDFCGSTHPFDMIVIDELSSFKAPSSQRFKALRKMLPTVKRVAGLTGTPAPNGLMDLWSEIYLLDRGKRLGCTVTGFRNKYFTPGRGNGRIVYNYIPRPGAEAEIKAEISDICVSMSKEDYLTLPPCSFEDITVKLSPEERKAYKRFERDAVADFDGKEITAASAAVLSGKLLQLSGGAVYAEDGTAALVHSAKAEALSELAESCGNMLIAYQFRHELPRIIEALKPYAPRVLEGKKDIEDWNAGRIKALIVHPASAGHGLNLQRGGHVIVWFTLTWSLELYMQFNARLARQGQEYPVTVYRLIADSTIDKNVSEALTKKQTGQQALLDAVRAVVEKEQQAHTEMPARARVCARDSCQGREPQFRQTETTL